MEKGKKTRMYEANLISANSDSEREFKKITKTLGILKSRYASINKMAVSLRMWEILLENYPQAVVIICYMRASFEIQKLRVILEDHAKHLIRQHIQLTFLKNNSCLFTFLENVAMCFQ